MLSRIVPFVVMGVFLVEETLLYLVPSLFAGLARLPLAASRTFELPARTVPRDESGYRDPAATIERALGPLPARIDHADYLASRPDGTFLVRESFPRMRFVARIHAERDGDLVTLRASWLPMPLSMIPLVLGTLVLTVPRLVAAGSSFAAGLGLPIVLGLMVGASIGVLRARSACLESVAAAMERIEEAARAAA